jgi:cell division protein FtsX
MRRPIIYEAVILAVLGFLLGLIIAAAIIHLRFR